MISAVYAALKEDLPSAAVPSAILLYLLGAFILPIVGFARCTKAKVLKANLF
jgi:hypothetical protein